MNTFKYYLPSSLCILGLLLLFSSCEIITLEEYQLTDYDGDLTWSLVQKKSEWPKRFDHESVAFKDKLWIFGGYNPGLINGDTYLEDVWNSADGISWTLVTDRAPWLGRRGHSVIIFDDGSGEALYLIGGFSVDEDSGYRQYNNDVWKSTDGHDWTQLKENSDAPYDSDTDWLSRMHHKTVTAEHNGVNYIYLIGGRHMKENVNGLHSTKYFNDVWRSPDGQVWERVLNNNFGIRAEHAVTVSPEGKIYIQGGVHGIIFDSEDNSAHPIADWHHLWTSSDGKNWEKEQDFEQVEENMLWRSGHEMVYYKDKIWALPGKNTSNQHYGFTKSENYSTWTQDKSGNWTMDSFGTAIDARHGYSALTFKDKIWVIGGFTNSNGQSNDVWAGSLN